ncbi:porin [Cupriavidus sp. RAF12]|uniref:porin n=1 Tax=Cupriavidus sp. RAF12 TaxID=3233050 RepID=UPI003F9039F7
MKVRFTCPGPLVPLAIAGVTTCFSGAAHAQSNVSLWGILDAGVRYATNANAARNGKLELSEGPVFGSRFGLRGSEDLGGGTSAFFELEAGMDMGTGNSLQSSASAGYTQVSTNGQGRLFGRQAFVGMDSRYGALSFGRQYSVAYQAMANAQIFGNPNLDTLIIAANYTGNRQDNAVKYEKSFGNFRLGADYAFGETAGNSRANSGGGVALSYEGGGARVAGTFASLNSADGKETRNVWGLGGGYGFGPFKATLGYMGVRYRTADVRNDVAIAGFSYNPNAAWRVGVGGFRDWQRDPGGSRSTAYGIIDYYFSKRTTAYLEVDYNRIAGAYTLLKSQGVVGGKIGSTLGLRHNF